jgi:sugar phosphate isomerase/epimerase
MRFAICNEIFQGWRLEDAMAFAARAGYAGIEIAPFTIAPDVRVIDAARRREIGRAAAERAIEITGIHWVLAQTEGFHITHFDGAVRERTAAYLAALVDFCADIGGHFMVVGSPKQRGLLPGVTLSQARGWAAEVFRSVVARAEQRDVTVCLEPLAPTETDFINTAAEAVAFVTPFQSAALRVILDVKAMSSETTAIPEIIRQTAPQLAYFHANDKNLKGPGFGTVEFAPIAAALREAGYDGWVSVEVFRFEEGPEAIATRSLNYLRSVFV